MKKSLLFIKDQKINRYEFDTFEDLEKYFVKEVVHRKDISSKVIGKVLLVFPRREAA